MDPLLPDHGPTRLLLVRHAQSTWNASGRWQGQANPPLSDHGHRQAASLASHPRLAGIDELLTSDLERARQTAAAIGAAHATVPTPSELLRELDVGSWSGLTRDEIEAEQPGAVDRYRAGIAGWEGGETFEQHSVRCREAAAWLAGRPDAETVAAVTHGGTMRMLVAALLGLADADRALFAGAGHATVVELRRQPHGWQLVAYGD